MDFESRFFELRDELETLKFELEDRIERLEHDLAASQAREKALRDALDGIDRLACETRLSWLCKEALRKPTDDSALKARMKHERERCIGAVKNILLEVGNVYAADECEQVICALGDKI